MHAIINNHDTSYSYIVVYSLLYGCEKNISKYSMANICILNLNMDDLLLYEFATTGKSVLYVFGTLNHFIFKLLETLTSNKYFMFFIVCMLVHQ